jgi:hypothetical protein
MYQCAMHVQSNEASCIYRFKNKPDAKAHRILEVIGYFEGLNIDLINSNIGKGYLFWIHRDNLLHRLR